MGIRYTRQGISSLIIKDLSAKVTISADSTIRVEFDLDGAAEVFVSTGVAESERISYKGGYVKPD